VSPTDTRAPLWWQSVRQAFGNLRASGRLAATGMLVVLVAVNVVTNGLVFHSRGSDRPPAVRGGSVAAPAPSSSGSAPWSADPASFAEPPLDAVGEVVLRAPVGRCGADGSPLFRSADGGLTWQALAAPAPTIMRVRVLDSERAWLVAADAQCRPHFYLTTDGGRSWQTRPSTAGTWYRLPTADTHSLHAPDGVVDSPCRSDVPIREVSALTLRTAAVLCGDGSLYGTQDGAASWHPTGQLPGALAIDFPTQQVGFVAASAPECTGVRISGTGDGGRNWQSLGCVPTDQTEAVALDFRTPTAGLLATLTATYATDDGGRSWHERGAPRKPPVRPALDAAAGSRRVPQ
jgi:photosystem II stability/assembly factor-like uncharacterized protein